VTAEQLLPLMDALNPGDEPGRLTLIHRLGNVAIAYKSTVDPRLNYEQSLELAMLIVRKSGGMA
jgi:3-deoxy-D-arabino-heptulosonate 7-phosphate (DAHP) synthase class II